MVDPLHTPASAAALRSPFAGHPAGEFPNRAGALGVHLSARLLPGTALVSTWTNGVDGLLAALQSAWGPMPTRVGACCSTHTGLFLRTGPEEFLVLAHNGLPVIEALREAVPADVGAVVDLGHARCCIRVQGAQCRATLNKLFALDLRDAAFPIGEVRLTGTHHVPCALYRVGDEQFDMLVFSTYAYDQLSTVMDAALEYGVSVTLVG